MTNEDQRTLKDSGQRLEFSTGAVRDVVNGKGRYDLMPADAFNLLADAIAKDPLAMEVDLADYWEMGRYNLAKTLVTNKMEYAVAAMRELAGYIQVKFWRDNSITPSENQLRLMPPHSVFRVARVYEKGAIKYVARNWEKGINLARFLDSAQRHWYQVLEGKDDEDHAAQALWNIVGWVQTRIWIDEHILPLSLDDMPRYKVIQEQVAVAQ